MALRASAVIGAVLGCSVGCFLVFALVARPAHGQSLTLQLEPGPGRDFAQQVGLSIPALEAQLTTQLREYFQVYRIGDFLRELGDGQSFTNRGLGVDYASDFDVFCVGAGANLAFNLDSVYDRQRAPGLVDFGRGVNATIMAGMNLDALGWGPISIYANYFLYRHKLGVFDARTNNFGFHVQLQLWKPDTDSLMAELFRWGGVDITTGIEQEKGLLALTGTLSTELPLDQVSPQAVGSTVKVDAMGDIFFFTRAVTMPIEATTNLRLLHLVSLYGGLGYDFKLASAVNGYMNARGALTGRVPTQAGRQDIGLGAATVQVTHQSRLSAGALRVLGGVQVNVLWVKLFVHGNLMVSDPVLTSLGAGVRIAY